MVPSAPLAISTGLPRHSTVPRSATSETACVTMLHAIISGTASVGGRICRSTAPATAENANPTRPDTTAPAKMPAQSTSCKFGSKAVMDADHLDDLVFPHFQPAAGEVGNTVSQARERQRRWFRHTQHHPRVPLTAGRGINRADKDQSCEHRRLHFIMHADRPTHFGHDRQAAVSLERGGLARLDQRDKG